MPFRKRPALHAFDLAKPVADIAAEILARVVRRRNPTSSVSLDMQSRRAETAERLAKAVPLWLKSPDLRVRSRATATADPTFSGRRCVRTHSAQPWRLVVVGC